MPLSIANEGTILKIVKVGGLEKTHRHLEELGLVPGTEVKIVNKIADNLILQVRDSRIGIDASLASKIIVSEAGNSVKSESESIAKNKDGMSFATVI
ncbi:MAG: ferrous iron transport protein A [Eubacterium sp.]|nr:ferrous iron transport protein A [Eubacterium sp.]